MLALGLAAVITLTSFMSGVFGMAGGMVLLLVLLAMGLDVATAMALHGLAQATGNLWRVVTWRRFTRWRIVGYFAGGTLASVAIFSLFRFEPNRAVVLIMLGLAPFLAMALPKRWVPQADRPAGGLLCGFASMAVTLVAGVAGPLVDSFFIRTGFDRKTIVATKAGCQLIGNLTKTAYFLALSGMSVALGPELLAVALIFPILGTFLSKFILEWMSEAHFQRYTRFVIGVVGLVSIYNGVMEIYA
ncbi:TSUP family transporter [Devosia sp. 919]|uniref:TSUP family transporter n=1 Tax=Devosia sp. 919 TaxID=2726065 RepID=UPI0015560187|nr:TSUP family transporter [Devosia sp. 919]